MQPPLVLPPRVSARKFMKLLEIFELAALRRVPVFVHIRSSGPVDPGAVDGLQEMLSDALPRRRVTRCAYHKHGTAPNAGAAGNDWGRPKARTRRHNGSISLNGGHD